MPPGVIQFVPGPPAQVVGQAINHRAFSGLHFTGSTFVFKKLWKDIAANLDKYRGYPRIVGETGGKNFHLVHKSAEVRNAVLQSVRAGFEYQGNDWKKSFCLWVTKFDFKDKNVQPFLDSMFLLRSGKKDSRISSSRKLRRSKSVRNKTGATLWVL